MGMAFRLLAARLSALDLLPALRLRLVAGEAGESVAEELGERYSCVRSGGLCALQ